MSCFKKVTAISFLVFLLIFQAGCMNSNYNSLAPKMSNNNFYITELRWSPDNDKIAILSNNNIYIIHPDGSLVENIGRADNKTFEGYDWAYLDNSWSFIDLSKERQRKYSIEEKSKAALDDLKKGNNSEGLLTDILQNYDIQNVTELIKAGENQVFCILRNHENYQVIKIDMINKSCEKIFESPEILFRLTSYHGSIFFIGANSINENNRYNIYKIGNNNIERVLLRHS